MPDRASGRHVPVRKEREDSVAVETNRSEVDESNNDAWAGWGGVVCPTMGGADGLGGESQPIDSLSTKKRED